MRTVLCYGDSNTWGYDPASKHRFRDSVRWTGVLQHLLSNRCRVIEEGLNGRTTVWPDPIAEYRNGKQMLIPTLETHKPLELVILMLGVNDCKRKFAASAYDIAPWNRCLD
jgi:lysophospholipase L1-like esterase